MNQISKHFLRLAAVLLIASAASGKVTTASTEIQSVNASDRKITVRNSGEVTTLALSDSAKILTEQ